MIHNAIVYATDLIGGINRSAGLIDAEGVIRLSESLQAVIDPWRSEWSYLRNERLGAQRVTQGAVVAEFSIIALINPAGSNHLVIVESIREINTGISKLLQMATEAEAVATLGAAANGVLRDRRFNIPNNPTVAVTRGGSDPALIGQSIDAISGSATIGFHAVPIILPPGEACAVVSTAVNIALDTTWAWRERPLLPSERRQR